MTPQDLDTLFHNISQFDKHLGLEFNIHDAGEVDFLLKIKDHHLSSPQSCHGGVLAAMMDTVLGLTVLSYSVTVDQLCSTVEFKINMLKEVKLNQTLKAKADLDYKGNKIVVASALILDAQTNEAVAKGLGTFNLYPLSKKNLTL